MVGTPIHARTAVQPQEVRWLILLPKVIHQSFRTQGIFAKKEEKHRSRSSWWFLDWHMQQINQSCKQNLRTGSKWCGVQPGLSIPKRPSAHLLNPACPVSCWIKWLTRFSVINGRSTRFGFYEPQPCEHLRDNIPVGAGSLHWSRLSNTPGLYQPDTSSTPHPQVVTTKIVSRLFQISYGAGEGARNCPKLRNTILYEETNIIWKAYMFGVFIICWTRC